MKNANLIDIGTHSQTNEHSVIVCGVPIVPHEVCVRRKMWHLVMCLVANVSDDKCRCGLARIKPATRSPPNV